MSGWKQRVLSDKARFDKMLDKAWDQHDTDKSGSLDKAECKEAFYLFFKSLKETDTISDAEVDTLMARFDSDKSGSLDKNEFIAVIKAYLSDDGKV